MDELYLCPDCLTEHAQPLDATLGHVARCLACEIVAGVTTVPVYVEPTQERVVAIETHLAA
jgi:hypothetical protein